MTRADELKQLYGYDQWATTRVLDALAGLTDEQFVRDMGSSFPSLRDTLAHIMSANWVWLQRWQGQSPERMREDWEQLSFDQLRPEWAKLDAAVQAFVARVSDAELDRTIAYRNMAGEACAAELGQMLRHVVNHSTYHRGQVTTMLRQLGATPPSTDLINYYREFIPAPPSLAEAG